MTTKSKEATTPQSIMKFGRAPNVLGIVGALIGGVAWPLLQPDVAPEASALAHAMPVLSGVVFGFGTGWLAGLIGAMGNLGD